MCFGKCKCLSPELKCTEMKLYFPNITEFLFKPSFWLGDENLLLVNGRFHLLFTGIVARLLVVCVLSGP